MDYKQLEATILQKLKTELKLNLYYHGVHHTQEVLENINEITKHEKVTKGELKLLKIAALFHDIGFINSYLGHEEEGCKIARVILKDYGLEDSQLVQICGMIMATQIPQLPNNKLEKIIADADLMYLGTDNFKAIGDTLYKELVENDKIKTLVEWNNIQVTFMSQHKYHTQYCIDNFTEKKQENKNTVADWLQKHNFA